MSACLQPGEHLCALGGDRQLIVCGPDAPNRAAIESFIRRIYRRRYGAQIKAFTPVLLGLLDEHEALIAAVGYRHASTEQLFLERYFDDPIEQVIAKTASTDLPRTGLAEVAHLVALRPGEGRHIMRALGTVLWTQGTRWIVSTVTQELRHLFLRVGITPLALGIASPERLGDSAQDWGSYYSHEPVVLAVQLQQALRLNPRTVAGV